jgi:hypothetical protein
VSKKEACRKMKGFGDVRRRLSGPLVQYGFSLTVLSTHRHSLTVLSTHRHSLTVLSTHKSNSCLTIKWSPFMTKTTPFIITIKTAQYNNFIIKTNLIFYKILFVSNWQFRSPGHTNKNKLNCVMYRHYYRFSKSDLTPTFTLQLSTLLYRTSNCCHNQSYL